MNNQEFFQEKMLLMPDNSNISLQNLNPLFDKNNFSSRKIQALLLKLFLNPKINITQNLMKEIIKETFKSSEPIENDNIDFDEIYFTKKGAKNIMIEIKGDSLMEKNKFISKKRKSPENNSDDSHDSHTHENSKILDNEISPIYKYRLDYYKKAFKSNLVQYLTDFLNLSIIPKCRLPREFKDKKIYKPNNLHFTANSKDLDNFEFLNMSLGSIFGFVKEGSNPKGTHLQKKNKEFIKKILNYKPDIENENLKILKDYLEMRFEDFIIEYYQTDDFKKFSKNEKIQFYEKEFIKEKKFPMLKEYGYLKLLKINFKNFSN